jgi:ABC-2 type transport system permease protein
MQRLGRIIQQFLLVYYAFMVEYRAELVFWLLSGSLPIILMGAWIQAASQSGGTLSGLGPVDFARYFFTAFIVRQFTVVWVIWDFEREIIEGKLAFRLLQPLDPIWHHVMSHLAERGARLPMTAVLVPFFFWLYPQAWWVPSLSQWALAAVAVVLAFVLRFITQYTMALCAFWTERARALEDFWFLLYLFLSGYTAPLDVFPPALRELVLWTPFPYLIHFPTSILIGLPVDLGRGFAVMVAWIGLTWLLNRVLWRSGLKQFSGMGA